jgi:hypothetical protein
MGALIKYTKKVLEATKETIPLRLLQAWVLLVSSRLLWSTEK